jgi:hypothetical protein
MEAREVLLERTGTAQEKTGLADTGVTIAVQVEMPR